MIHSMCLKNFKPFENQFFELKPLTLLSGLNSTGKSSLLQSLLLLRQSYQQGLLPNIGLALNGELVRIGTAQDALCERAKEDFIEFGIIWENNLKGIWRFNSDALPVSLNSDTRWNCSRLVLAVTRLEDEELIDEHLEIVHASRRNHVQEHADWIKNRIQIAVSDGVELWNCKYVMGVCNRHLQKT